MDVKREEGTEKEINREGRDIAYTGELDGKRWRKTTERKNKKTFIKGENDIDLTCKK